MEVHLEAFDGPMDLLLHLVRRSEIDIFDIPIAKVAAEYMAIISNTPPDMGEMSDFLVMAATLLEIKSKMLLPSPKKENEPDVDPRHALAEQLIAYEEAKEAAAFLQTKTEYTVLFGKGDSNALDLIAQTNKPADPLMDLISLNSLLDIFHFVISKQNDRIDSVRSGYSGVKREKFSITAKILYMQEVLQKKGSLNLLEFFTECNSKREIIVTFLAFLEMIRRGFILATQNNPFSDIEVVSCPA